MEAICRLVHLLFALLPYSKPSTVRLQQNCNMMLVSFDFTGSMTDLTLKKKRNSQRIYLNISTVISVGSDIQNVNASFLCCSLI